MRIFELAASAALLTGLGACGAGTANNQAAAGNGLARTESAETPVGPCPFPTRNWRAVVIPARTEVEVAQIELKGEIQPDAAGHLPTFSTRDDPPPAVFLDIASSTNSDGGGNVWRDNGDYFTYQPGHVTAVIRCNGHEIARVPIRPPAAP